MLKPTKHLNLEYSVLNISSVLLKILMENKIIGYDDLLRRLIVIKGQRVKGLYLKSLCFLFAIRKIKYYKNKDVIEFVL